MAQFYRVLADAVVLLHFAFLAFVALGGFLVVYRWRSAWLHLPAAAWGTFVEFRLHVCPLTPLENALRVRSGGQGYSGDFITHYIDPVIYPPGLTPDMQFILGLMLVVANILLYAWAWRRHRWRG